MLDVLSLSFHSGPWIMWNTETIVERLRFAIHKCSA